MSARLGVPNARLCSRVGRLSALAVVLLATLVGILGDAWLASPRPNDLPALVARRLSQNGEAPVRLSAVAPVMRQAVVATEDERFYRHQGIDTFGLARSVGYDVTHLSLAEGASTIPEQLAKVLYLRGNDRSPWRKLLDAMCALRMDHEYSKQEILEAYLNTVYFGHGTYGIRAAAARYFGTDPAHLDLAQASLLAGVIQAPSSYDPLLHPSLSRSRQVAVLRSMVRNGFITVDEGADVLEVAMPVARGAALPPIAVVSLAPGPLVSAGWFAAGIAVLAAGAAGWVLGRRRAGYRWRLGAVAVTVAGLVTMARSFRAA